MTTPPWRPSSPHGGDGDPAEAQPAPGDTAAPGDAILPGAEEAAPDDDWTPEG